MKERRLFETWQTIYQSAGCHNSEDLNLQQHRRENLRGAENNVLAVICGLMGNYTASCGNYLPV